MEPLVYTIPTPEQQLNGMDSEAAARAESQLADLVFSLHADPLGFVLAAYPWGEPGPLEKYQGPDTWQRELLLELGEEIKKNAFNGSDPVDPVQITRSSGHGIGKGVMTAFLVNFLMSTRPGAIGTVTANSYPQLETKTWATVQKWTKLCFTSHWFNVTGERLFKTDMREQWFTAAMSCAEENSEAFAGQHNATSTSFYIFDEASNIPDKIFEVANGGLTDGEPMIFVFGNPTKRSGRFFQINFGSDREFWNHKAIDSRLCQMTNKKLLERWRKMWGEDSDMFRVRVRGLPPSASDNQFIPVHVVAEAQKRDPIVLRNDPIIGGLDISRGGADNCVLRFRRGKDATTIPPIIIRGKDTRDSTVIENKVLDILRNGVPIPDVDNEGPFGIREGYQPGVKRLPVTMIFVDATGVGGPVCDHLKALGFSNQVTEIQFAWEAPNSPGHEECGNMRTWMWLLMREFLEQNGVIDNSSDLEMDLTAPLFTYNAKNQLMLEPKEAIKKRLRTEERSGSPDNGDALALTFARPVAPRKKSQMDEETEFDDENWDSAGFSTRKGSVWG